MTATITITGLDKVIAKYGSASVDKAVVSALEEVTAYTATLVKRQLSGHTRTGFLRASITGEAKSPKEGKTFAQPGSGVYYAKFVEHGTGVHGPTKQRIVPKHAKAMAWHSTTVTGNPNKGDKIVRRSVAGQKPVKMFANTVEHSHKEIGSRFAKAFISAITK